MAAQEAASIGVLLGNGDGSFAAATQYADGIAGPPTSASPISTATTTWTR